MNYRFRQILLTLLALAVLSGCDGWQQASRAATANVPAAGSAPGAMQPFPVTTTTTANALTSAPMPPTAATALSNRAVLPAPLYFLDGENQIGRLEPDGMTYSTLTQEPYGVSEFDVSPRDGTVLFIPRQDSASNQADKLVRIDARGGNRTELLAGSIRQVHWAPDGSTFALLWQDGPQGSGIYVNRQDGPPALLIRNQLFNPKTRAAGQIFEPRAWSPDSTRLLLIVGPDNGPDQPAGDVFGVNVVSLAGEMTQVIAPSGEAANCGVPFWSTDSTMLYCASVGADDTMAALWRISVASGTPEVLARPEKGTLLGFPALRQLPDGSIYALVQTTAANGAEVLSMQRRNADGSGARDLRPELLNHMIEALGALWANDGSGLLAKDQQVQGERGLVWIPTDGGPIVALPGGSSHTMQWGATATATSSTSSITP